MIVTQNTCHCPIQGVAWFKCQGMDRVTISPWQVLDNKYKTFEQKANFEDEIIVV